MLLSRKRMSTGKRSSASSVPGERQRRAGLPLPPLGMALLLRTGSDVLNMGKTMSPFPKKSQG